MYKLIFSKKFLVLLCILGLFLSIFLGNFFYNRENIQITNEFKNDVRDKIVSIKREAILNNEILYSILGLFENSENVTFEEFENLSLSILKRHDDIKALEWIPKITKSQREVYTSKLRKYFPNYEITQRASQGKMVKRDISDVYFPVYYLTPYEGNELALGFDLASNNKRLETINKAIEIDDIISTAPIKLVQSKKDEKGFLTLIPVFKPTNKGKDLKGFVLAVFKINELVNKALSNTQANDIIIEIYDVSEKVQEKIYSNKTSYVNYTESSSNFQFEQKIKNQDGRVWKIVATPTTNYINKKRTILPIVIIFTGILFIIITTFYINMIIEQNKAIEEKVEQRTKELNEANEKLKKISRTDSLTKVANRRYFNEKIQNEWQRAIREHTSISLMILDVDYFKLYNDKYGHLEGDRCLKEVAYSLRSSLNRSSDFLARFGGEEFIIILPNTNDALAVAETCRRNIEKLAIAHEFSKVSEYVTISIGITSIAPDTTTSLTNFINEADKALYKAKNAGRNCIEII